MTRPQRRAQLDLAAELRKARRARQLGRAATCQHCQEANPLVLKRAGEQALCFRCAAESRRRTKPPRPLSARTCLACSFTSPTGASIEQHHILARAHHETWTVPLCKNCHALVTDWQYRNRVDFSAQRHWLPRLDAAVRSTAALASVTWSEAPTRASRTYALVTTLLAAVSATLEACHAGS